MDEKLAPRWELIALAVVLLLVLLILVPAAVALDPPLPPCSGSGQELDGTCSGDNPGRVTG